MLTIIAEDLARYVEAHCSAEPALLEELRAETVQKLEDPQMQVGRVEGTLLRLLVGLSGARRVLEIGTYSGYSALSMAAALPDGGRLVTCDIDPIATTVAQKYFDRSPHGTKIELRLGDAQQTVEALRAAGASFDFVFIDADKEGYVAYWEGVLPMIPAGGLVVVDNALWSARVLHPTSASDHGVVAFNDHVTADERVDHVLLSVRDGVMLARKR
jgi:caffeoyl-CoA O-methyltransferase